MSHLRSMVLDNRKYQWSGSDVGRIMRRSNRRATSTPREGRNALDTKVVAEGEGPAGEAEVAVFEFFRGLRRPDDFRPFFADSARGEPTGTLLEDDQAAGLFSGFQGAEGLVGLVEVVPPGDQIPDPQPARHGQLDHPRELHGGVAAAVVGAQDPALSRDEMHGVHCEGLVNAGQADHHLDSLRGQDAEALFHGLGASDRDDARIDSVTGQPHDPVDQVLLRGVDGVGGAELLERSPAWSR